MASDNSDNEGRNNVYAESEAEEGDGVIHSDEENNENQNNEPQTEQTNENKEAEEEKKEVKPKRVVRNPQPKLNAETLKGPRGLKALDGYFKNVKYKGKGHEIEDLQVILKTYEHWCHRLFPKLPFDDCIKKLETLGSKKPVITYLKKIRLGMEDDDEDNRDVIQNDQEADDMNEDIFNDHAGDIFDRLVQERPAPVQAAIEEEDTALTEEQLERIRINRELALERRRLRMQQAARNEQEASNTQLNAENVEDLGSTGESALQSSGNATETATLREESTDLEENASESQENRANLQENAENVEDSSASDEYVDENDSGALNRERNVGFNPPLIVAPTLQPNPDNNFFKGPQEKLIFVKSNSDDVANEALLVEISHDSDQPSEVVIEDLSESSTNVLGAPKENLLSNSSGPPLTSSSNVEVDEMDVD